MKSLCTLADQYAVQHLIISSISDEEEKAIGLPAFVQLVHAENGPGETGHNSAQNDHRNPQFRAIAAEGSRRSSGTRPALFEQALQLSSEVRTVFHAVSRDSVLYGRFKEFVLTIR
jgi:hypothetical protein